MHFKIVGRIENVEPIASGKAIRERKRVWEDVWQGTLEETERHC
jgi:hypothetical protein